MSLFALAKITVKVDKATEVSDPVKEMLLEKVKDVPDDYVIKLADVKQAYPDIAEKLKEALFKNKSSLTVKEVKLIVKDMDVTSDKFWLSEVPFTLNVQKKLNKSQVVLQFNFTPEMVKEIKSCQPAHSFLTKMFATKEGSTHPLNNQTFAWARVYKFDNEWVIEEMQSDFIGWDTGFKSMTKEQQGIFDKFSKEDQKEMLAFFKKHFDKWEHTLLASVMQMARSKKVKRLLIFDESEKQDQGTSPSKLKWFYRTIPKHMGMKQGVVGIGSEEYSVWEKVLASVKPTFKKMPFGYNSYGHAWTKLKTLKQLEVKDRGNQWFDDSKLDLENTLGVWVTVDPRDALLYVFSSTFRDALLEDGSLDEDYKEELEDEWDDFNYAMKHSLEFITKVNLEGAQPVVEHDEEFGKSYLYIKPVYTKDVPNAH